MIYAFGQHELDTRVYELRRAGVVRPVEPQVFDVLAYLVQNRDRVVSKEELLEKLWPDRFVTETTLTSRVKEARKAVGDSGANQSVIRTQRGRGYRFVASIEERGDPDPSGLVVSVSPDNPTSEKYEPHATATFVDLAIPSESRSSSFVGRRRELERLTAILRLAVGGKRQVAFITGEAGAGKTTLVDTFLDAISSASPILVARGQCVEYRGTGEAYMPLLDAFSRLASGTDRETLISLMKRDAPSWVVQMPSIVSDEELALLRARTGTGGERMVRELGMMVDRLTADTPLVLVLEDLHWSDYATLDAIDLLAKQLQPARLMIIGTWRPSDVKAARHPVYALTQELRVRGQREVVSLPLFGSDELDAYLKLRLGDASFNAHLNTILHARTAGNALFVGNLVDSWIERELLRKTDEGWTLGAGLEELERDVPDSLQHLIESQIAELGSEQQRMLETASVIGRTFPIALIAATLPAADDDLENECARLVREANIIRNAGTEQWGDGSLTSRFSFVHDLYADVLYSRIPAVRRSRLHQQIGLALERAWDTRAKQHAPELALHFTRALDRTRGPKYLLLAAEQALERSAYREVVDHLSTAVDLLEGAPESTERSQAELQIHSKLAPALVATRGWVDSKAEESYLRARDLADTLGETHILSQTLYGLANLYEYRGEYDLSERITKERIALQEPGSQAQILESHELLTCSLLHQGRYQESVRHGETAIAAFEDRSPKDMDPDHLALVVQAHGWISGSLHLAGRADDALVHSRRALTLSAESGNELARASANIHAAFLRFYRREAEECSELACAGESIGREYRFPFHVGCGRILQGWAASTHGDHEAAIRQIRHGIRTSEALGARIDMPLFFAILADVLARAGEPGPALDAIDTAIEIVNRGRTFFYVPELNRQRGLILLELGRRDEAVDSLQRALALAEEQECTLFELRAARDLAAIVGDDWQERVQTICESFHQGLDTIDLREAKAIVE